MAALAFSTLGSLGPGVQRPPYDPARVPVGIIHLGLGAFHRAHQALYTDRVLADDPRWGICGVSLKTPRATRTLAAQDGLYSVLEKSPEGTSVRVVGSLREMLFLGSDAERLYARFADPAVRIVTLTVTEKGYCHDPATGKLNLGHPEIVHDLETPSAPVSAPGVIVQGLLARKRAGAGAITVVCCDNLPHNGRVVEGIVRAFAQARDPALDDWIATHVRFPSTMVDRIVPATTERDVAEVRERLGVDDAAPVVCEPYIQWVIEDSFAGERPAWELAGAQLVRDVAPFETMKLRLLNGSHSTLAYLGFLAGHEYIWQASSDADLGRLVERLMAEEVAPTVPPPPGVDLAAYRAQLLRRFRNPVLPHRTRQIAMDGSQKLPQRLLNTVRERLAGEGSIAHLALAIAGWIRYCAGRTESGDTYVIEDPLASKFAELTHAAQGDPARLAAAFLDLAPVFGDDLPRHLRFRAVVTANVVSLFRQGVRATLTAHLATPG